MIVHHLCLAPPPELALALERFEEQFRYPLGPGRTFRIAHGADYPRFFRAMGEAACFVAERNGQVLGVIGTALRRLLLPSGETLPAVYLGDLKIDPAARGGRLLPKLAQAVEQWARGRAHAAFGVVMDGTPAVPTRYTGRLGIPLFRELGKIVVLRLAARSALAEPGLAREATESEGIACFERLSAGRYASLGGNPAERSAITPLWLVERAGGACGRLEDTRRAKRLIADDGGEMISAHLSCFAYQDVQAGVTLLRTALGRAVALGFPALFVAVAAQEADAFRRGLEGLEVIVAPATVFGAGLDPAPLWNVNTAEI